MDVLALRLGYGYGTGAFILFRRYMEKEKYGSIVRITKIYGKYEFKIVGSNVLYALDKTDGL